MFQRLIVTILSGIKMASSRFIKVDNSCDVCDVCEDNICSANPSEAPGSRSIQGDNGKCDILP